MTNWVTKIGDFNVERMEGPRPGGQAYLKLDANPDFCVHTTEGTTVAGAVSTLRKNYSAPHFVVGEDRIVQMRPLWAQGATLRSHNDRYIQVECVGKSSLRVHTLTPATWRPLVALTKYLHENEGIQLKRPDSWDDKLPAEVWAANNSRRKSRKALTERGVYGHVDVPDQDPSWHWDPGSLNYTQLFAEAGKPTPEEEDELMYAEFKEGVLAFRKGDPIPATATADFIFGWNFARWAKDDFKIVRKRSGP